jgi:xanthine dehydrogenase accessory factor
MVMKSDNVLEMAAHLKQQRKPFALVSVVRCESPASAKPGAKAIVDEEGNIHGWIGGGCAQPAVLNMVKKALENGQARLIRVSPNKADKAEEGIIDFGMTCHSGGTLDIFIDPIIARPSLLVIGVSPSAQSLVALAHRSGFDVIAAFPGADEAMFSDAVQIIDGLDVSVLESGKPDYVVVATQGKRDEPGLEAALSTKACYIAFIASGRKMQKMRNYLKERGHDPERVDAIIAPVGVEIGAVSYEEIALSVAAGLVKARRLGDKNINPEPTDTNLKQITKTSCCASINSTEQDKKQVAPIDPVCAMSIEVSTAEYISEYQQKKYYFCCAGCLHSFEKSPAKYLSEPNRCV